MGYRESPLSYDELRQEFDEALNCVVSGAVLPPSFAMLDVTLTLALLDIAYAVRVRRPTQPVVERACAAFTAFAVHNDAAAF